MDRPYRAVCHVCCLPCPAGCQAASPSGSPAVWQAGRQPGSPAGCAWQLSAADQQYATFHVTGVWELVKESQTGNAVSAGKIFEI